MISTLDEKELWESELVARLMRDVAAAQAAASRPLVAPPNPFEEPRRPGDPPPIWETLPPPPAKARARPSWAPFLFTLFVGAATVATVAHPVASARARHALEGAIAWVKAASSQLP